MILCLTMQVAVGSTAHFNENANCKQAQTKGGEDRYDIIFPKYKKGGYVVRKVVLNPT